MALTNSRPSGYGGGLEVLHVPLVVRDTNAGRPRPSTPRPSAPRPSAPRPVYHPIVQRPVSRPSGPRYTSSKPKTASGSRALRGSSVGTLRGRRYGRGARKPGYGKVRKVRKVLMHVPSAHAATVIGLGGSHAGPIGPGY